MSNRAVIGWIRLRHQQSDSWFPGLRQKNTNKEGYSYARWFDVDVVTFILVL